MPILLWDLAQACEDLSPGAEERPLLEHVT
jgi:hypothetical protein